MKQQFKSKPGDNQLIYDESIDPVDRASAISRLTVDGFTEIEPLLAELLHHESLFLRGQSVISLLTFFQKPNYLNDAMQMLHSDPEWMVRGKAAFALTQFASYSIQSQAPIIQELVRCLLHDDDSEVQRRCYEGLQQLLAPDRNQTSIPDDFNRERDVDWELLKPYLDEAQIPQSQLTR